MNFHLVCPVWNKVYIDLFFDRLLPYYLKSKDLNNIEGLRHTVSIQFYTLEDDRQTIANKSILATLKKRFNVAIHSNTIDKNLPKLLILTRLYEQARLDAINADAIIITVQPDTLYPENTFNDLIKLYEVGYRYVLAYGIPVNAETFLEELSNTPPLNNPREFSNLCLNHLHNEITKHQWNENYFSMGVDYIAWQIPDSNDYIIRAFRLHPMMLSPKNDILMYWTPDLDYIYRCCHADFRDVYVYENSNEKILASLQLSDNERFQLSDGSVKTRMFIAKWIHYATDPLHRKLFRTNIAIHSKTRQAISSELQKQIDTICNDILQLSSDNTNHFIATINQALSSNKKIAIYGAGAFGQMVANAFILNGCIPDAFFDTDKNKWGNIGRMIQVLAPNHDTLINYFIIIASNYFKEIESFLKKNQLNSQTDYITIMPEWIYNEHYK
ncbi:MAG: hypothetical protein HQL46_12935 [Gammaproteobacteria bacterium]|nr:hypothetical protein [Gammaproteobacteria bacterium]